MTRSKSNSKQQINDTIYQININEAIKTANFSRKKSKIYIALLWVMFDVSDIQGRIGAAQALKPGEGESS
uniref:Uncharacterized protein n=1 Tax=Nelumbo nucifera TaxID=4432 RepID=A0A822Z665_NELNU|nr:TPA_asm: hypothetical protein HUJ06_014423 [Nelumbo nucifera]